MRLPFLSSSPLSPLLLVVSLPLTHAPGSNRLEDMTRVPSDLRRYIAWSHATRKAYGSIQSYILATRLHWTLPLTPVNPIPFADSADTRILINDWPYGLVPGIVHLVCWTKCVIPTILPGEPGEGDLTPQARLVIQDWVDDTFAERLGAENVLWFKNWASIQSVRSVEHIHVLLRGATEEFLKEVVDDEPGRVLVGDLERKKEEEEGLL